METMNRNNIKMVRAELEKAINEVAKKHGMVGSLGTITFTVDSFRCKLEMVNSDSIPKDGKAKDKKFRDAYNQYAKWNGDNWLPIDSEITVMGKTLKIVGYNTRAKKFPIVVVDNDGKRYKVAKHCVLR